MGKPWNTSCPAAVWPVVHCVAYDCSVGGNLLRRRQCKSVGYTELYSAADYQVCVSVGYSHGSHVRAGFPQCGGLR